MKFLKSLLILSLPLLLSVCSRPTPKAENQIKDNAVQCDTVTSLIKSIDKDGFVKNISDYESSDDWKYLGDKPAVVDFYADWCRPCKNMEPVLEKMALKYKDSVSFYKVNVDNNAELVKLFAIQGIPSFVFISMDDIPKKIVGMMTEDDFEKNIKEILEN